MGLFNRKTAAAPAAVAVLDAPAATGTDLSHLSGDYTIDSSHSSIEFRVRHAMVTNVRGAFAEYDGRLHLDGANPAASRAELVIKVASVDTGNEQRDGHLRTGDFFAVETHPEITFRSTATEQLDADHYRLTGDLTIKATTRPVVLDLEFTGTATDPYGIERVGFEGSTTVDRTEFGLTYNAALETGGVLIGEKVKLSFDISAVRAG
ncbi:polyisoprenoid-binding protein YceI [Kitasatospora sp. MAP12-15]|uniref:YceI family protein n=1 Tax=unclassified Kitasatospora TaxID=2633591 RepID=UPI002473F995|nr:YceI family protein [Kitasatospora sp. MAP12-44]MDH6111257.1 polyisoprenoid-binding protein YceI [Kitasatospora sp. MAP12-44]